MKIVALWTALVIATGGLLPTHARAMNPAFFDIPSTDGVTVHGQLDRPQGEPKAFVILVSGTGGFDRDVYLGRTGTDRDLIFLNLKNRLVAEGLAVVRFDKRGVLCDANKIKTFDAAGVPPGMWAPQGACFDTSAAEKTGARSGADDVTAVYNWTKVRARNVPIILFGHSEGVLHLAQAVEAGVDPAAIVGMGALMESPSTAYRWQRVDRIPESMAAMDLDKNDIVTNEEVRAGFARTPAAVFGNINLFLAPSGSFDQASLRTIADFWRDYYEKERTDALAKSNAEPLKAGDKVLGSYGWWKVWFSDSTPVAQRLARYPGPIHLFYGSIDSQTPAARQRPAVEKFLNATNVHLVEFDGLGHTLGRDVFFGPMEAAPLDRIVAAIGALATNARTPENRG